MTNNYERIKNMSVEEMAEFLQKTFDENEENFGCYGCMHYGKIEQALKELVKCGYMRKLKGDNYKLTNKGKGYAECLIKILQGE